VVTHACNPSIQEAEAGESQVPGQLGLHSKSSKPSLGCLAKPYLKKKKERKKEKPQLSNVL
jgi:hypothetical protein